MHGHPWGLPADHRPTPPHVGTEGQLALPQPSAVSLGHFEKISDVQQSLADVVPKALGVLWEPRLRPSVPTKEDSP